MQYLAHAGLALATSITAWLNAAILTFILKQKGLHQHSKETYVKLVRTFMASAVMGMGLLGFCLLYTSPSPRDLSTSRMPSSA